MNDKALRTAIIRLAHEKPELRGELLPMVKRGASRTAVFTPVKAMSDVAEAINLIRKVQSEMRGTPGRPAAGALHELAQGERILSKAREYLRDV